MGVREHLNLDVPSPEDEPLQEQGTVAERGGGFVASALDGGRQLREIDDLAHASSTAAGHCLDQ